MAIGPKLDAHRSVFLRATRSFAFVCSRRGTAPAATIAPRWEMSRRTTRLARCLPFILGGALSAALHAGGTVSTAAVEEVLTGRPTAGRIAFDIPSQPLAMALRAYSAATGVGVLVDGGLTAGRHSAAVTGVLAPEEALQTLLVGTGLAARYAAPTAFTLVPARPDQPRGSSDHSHYFLAVQAALKRVLCQREETQPGRYRIALQLWIDQSGAVLRADLLGSSGTLERDALISDVLKGVTIEPPPPAGLPQPVTVVVLPRPSARSTDCVRRDTGPDR